jgi:L-2-hydroxyglutarate oxidase LhgO
MKATDFLVIGGGVLGGAVAKGLKNVLKIAGLLYSKKKM